MAWQQSYKVGGEPSVTDNMYPIVSTNDRIGPGRMTMGLITTENGHGYNWRRCSLFELELWNMGHRQLPKIEL